MERTRHNHGSSPAGQFLSLDYRTIRALWILERTLSVTETLVRSAKHGRVGTGMQGKGKENQGKKDDNEVSSMSPNENVELYSNEGSFAEEDKIGAEQKKVPKSMEPDKPMIMEKTRGGRKKTSMTFNRYGDNFLIDKIKSDEIGAELFGVGELIPDQEWQIIKDLEQCETEKMAIENWSGCLTYQWVSRRDKQNN